MTHTLHPEIEKAIQRLVNRIKQDVVTGKEDDVYGLIIGYLGPYLLPPSQHLKDEPLPKDGDIRFNDDGLGTYIVDHEIKKMEWIPESNCRIHKFIA